MFGKPVGKLGAVGGRTLIQRAIAILRRFGQDAHIYLPGVGMLNGLQAGNFIDSAGTTPGTVDQPVGLVLDGMGGLGVELVTNAYPAPVNGFSNAGGVVTCTAVPAYTSAFGTLLSKQIAIGSTFALTYTVSGYTSGTIRIQLFAGALVHNLVAANGTYTVYLVADAAIGSVGLQATAVFTGAVSISVREVTGIAASQPTTSAKPILRRGAVNLLTYSGDFGNAAWSANGGASKSGSTFTLSTTYDSYIANPIYSANIGATYTAAMVLSGTPGVRVYLGICDLGGAFPRTNQVITLTATPTLYTVTRASITQAGIDARVTDHGAATTVTFGGAALFAGTYTAQQIQALGGIPLTTTAPASTALGPYFWQFDGSNDSLALGSVPFQMSDDFWFVAGAATSSALTTYREVYAQSNGSAGDALPEIGFTNTNRLQVNVSGGGTARSIISGVTEVAGTPSIVAVSSRSGVLQLKRNGVSQGTSTLGGTYTASTNALIGAIGRSAVGNYMNGSIYPMAFGKGTMTDADLLLIEKMLGQIAGVQI